MHPDLQRRVQRYGWDRASSHYEDFWKQQLKPAHDLLMEFVNIKPGDQVLDVACGTGLITLRIAALVGNEGKVVGTDLSEEMVAITQKVAEEEGFTNVTAEHMGAEKLSFPDESFDVALCALGLMYVPEPLEAVREMYRVLRPGGRCVVAIWGRRNNCGWADIFPIVDKRVKTDVCPLFFQQGGEGVLKNTFSEAGFSSIEEGRISTNLIYQSHEDALGAAFIGGPVATAYARFDDQTKQEAHNEYLESISKYQNESGYEIPGEFVVVSGIKS